MADKPRADRRKWPRFPVPDAKVYTAKPLLPRYLRKPNGKPQILVNISGGGLQYLAAAPLHQGAKISLLVKVPAFLALLMFRGRVVWTKKIDGKNAYRIGAEFVAIEKETRVKLESLRKDFFFRKKRSDDEKNSIIGLN